MRIQVIRGDLGACPADVYVLPSRGRIATEDSAADKTLRGLSQHFGVEFDDLLGMVRQSTAVAPGDARLVELKNPSLPRIALLNAIDGAYARPTLLQEAIESLVRQLPSAAKKRLTIALPAVGTGEGGLAPAKAAKAILATLGRIECDHEAVIVTWELGTYRAFLEVLHKERPRPHVLGDILEHCAPGTPESVARGLVECLTNPGSFLFVGSGFSRNAHPAMPAWSDLFDRAWFKGKRARQGKIRFSKEDVGYRLPDYAQMAADVHTRKVVHDRFIGEIRGRRSMPSVSHYQLLSLPWSSIVTTNYDTILEDTLDRLRIQSEVVADDAGLSRLPDKQGVPLIKIHGGIVRTNGKEAVAEIVATRDEYDAFFEQRPALAAYLETRLMTSKGVIVGYSVSDPHLRQMFARIGKDDTPLESRLYCISFESSPVQDYWKRRGLNVVVVRDGKVEHFRALLEIATTEAHRRIVADMVPADLLTAETWRSLAEGLSDGQTATLVGAMLSAGCETPPASVLERIFKNSPASRRLLERHISPERMLWLREAAERGR